MICQTCPWELIEGDNFCSWCGHKYATFDVHAEPRRFRQDDAHTARLTITNRSRERDLEVLSISPSAPWVSVGRYSQRIGPMKSEIVRLEIDPLELPDDYHRANVVVETHLGREPVTIEVTPTPELHVPSREFLLFLDNRADEDTSLDIELKRGIAQIRNIVVEPTEWLTVAPVGYASFPIDLDARTDTKLSLRLSVDEDYLYNAMMALEYPHTFEARLRVEGEGIGQETALRFVCWQPPVCTVWGGRDVRRAYLGRPGELAITIKNALATEGEALGRAPLEIREIEIRNEDGSPNTWLTPADSRRAIKLEGGQSRDLKFTFDPAALGIGTHRPTIVLRTNQPDQPEQKIRPRIEIAELADYPGILAIDFGTSNSCCALLRAGEYTAEVLAIDPAAQPATRTPTIIRYEQRLEKNEKQTEIGAEVESQLVIGPEMADSTARSLKSRLATNTSVEMRYRTGDEDSFQLDPREAVTDYLRALRRELERRQPYNFKQIVFTHPARWYSRQLADLTASFQKAFAPDGITSIPEPVAAALKFVLDDELRAVPRYTLGVFDFGGGTTDLSLLQVVNTDHGDGTGSTHASLAGSDGKSFGGEDLTYFILKHARRRCEEIAAAERPGAVVAADPESADSPARRWQARRNYDALFRWAEATKRLLVALGDDHEHAREKDLLFPKLELKVFAGPREYDKAFQHKDVVPPAAGVMDYLRTNVREIGAKLQTLVANSKLAQLDYLLLSGQSSAIRAVAEELAAMFPSASVRLSGEPKECVVAGACVTTLINFAGQWPVTIDVRTSTPARYGIVDVLPKGREFQAFFERGVPIPNEGLAARRPRFFWPNRPIVIQEEVEDGTYQETARFLLPEWPAELAGRSSARGQLELLLLPDLSLVVKAHFEGVERELWMTQVTGESERGAHA